MSFVFASSHLPEFKRPDDEDEEEEEEVRPMQRSGMVRAFSHLPPPVRTAPVAPRSSSPAPASRPAWAAAREAPSSHEPADGHDAEPDDDADDGHGPSASPHEPDDGRPWYLPRITAADLQPEGGEHDDSAPGSSGRPAKKWEPEHDPDPGFDGTPPKEWGEPTRDAGFDGSPQDVHNGTPAPDTNDAPPAARSAALPYGRLFEKRPTPGFSAPTDRPVFNELVYRQPPQDASSPAPARPRSLADIPGDMFQQVAAKTGAQQQAQSSPTARPSSAKPLPPQTPAQQGRVPTPPAPGGKPAAPAQASKPAPVQGAAPQSASPKLQRPLTELEKKELITDDGRVRTPKGQLGITAKLNIRDPNRTSSGKKPRTVCLYDGKEHRQKCDGTCTADAYALQQAAATYASADNWMIDISKPEWEKELTKLQENEEGNGRHIDRIMVFDHGGPGFQEFGNHPLKPDSQEWKTITSAVKVGGDIVLAGCKVAGKDWRGDGPAYLHELYRNGNGWRRPKIHAYDENVRHREGRWLHTVTAGEEHTIPLD